MNIIVCGAGEVGRHATEVLSATRTSITVIDQRADLLQRIEDTHDVATLRGNCAYAEVLREAGAGSAKLVLAATHSDEVNIVTASVAKSLGARQVVARVHHSAYFSERGFAYREQFGIDRFICPEYSAALAISDTLRTPGSRAIENFAGGAIEMQEFSVDPNSASVGKSLSEVGIPPGTRVAAILRGAFVFIPDASTQVERDDIIVLVGNANQMQEARKRFRKEKSGRQQVVVMGGASTAVWLCRALKDHNFSVRVFEADRERAEELAHKVDWVTVLNADPTDPLVFEEEHVGRADAFVALAADDEQNILVAAWAKSMGVEKAVALVQRTNYQHLLTPVGIDHAFSPRRVAVSEIEDLIDKGGLRCVSTIAEGVIDVFRVRIGAKAEVAGRPLREITLKDAVIAAVPDGDGARMPGPDDVLNADDTVLVIGRHGIEKSLRKLFATG